MPETIEWPSNIEVLVFVPLNRQYRGIDFIIARRTKNTLYIYFVQCTIQLPQDRPICETQLYEQWQNLLVSASKSTKYFSYIVFLTPHSTNLEVPGPASTAAFFRSKTKLHVRFAGIEGTHPLLEKIKTRFAHLSKCVGYPIPKTCTLLFEWNGCLLLLQTQQQGAHDEGLHPTISYPRWGLEELANGDRDRPYCKT